MSETKAVALAYPRLQIAYLLQFAIWGSWAGALGGYAAGTLKMSGGELGWLYMAIPLGAVISPLFIGPIADRFFPAQFVISALHTLGGLCLIACGYLCTSGQQTFGRLMTLILLSGICYMPTIALINSIVFKHIPDSKKAPWVFVFGTLGWIFVNLFIAAFCGGAATPNFFYIGGAISILLALYATTLPHTPPKGAPAPGQKTDAFGIGALTLFKDSSFLIFVLCAFLASIPACNLFFPLQVPFLTQRGYPSPLALTTINQFSELLFMAALPFFVAKIGLKRVLLIGMAAWSLRYFAFAQPGFEFALIGLLLHGFCYSFLYVAAYMYADRKAPATMKASVQSLMTFLLLGVAQVAGAQMGGYLFDQNKPELSTMMVAEKSVALPTWNDAKRDGSAWKYLDLAANVERLRGKAEAQQAPHLGVDVDTNGDNIITPAELNAIPEAGLTYGGITYSRKDLQDVFAQVAATSNSTDGSVTRDQWLAIQSNNWKKIFVMPAIFIAVFFVIFLVAGREPREELPQAA